MKINKNKILNIVWEIIEIYLILISAFFCLKVLLEGIQVLYNMILRSVIKDEAIVEVLECPIPLRNWIKHICIFVGAAICSRLPRIYKRTKNYIENKSRIDIFADFLKTLDFIQFLLVMLVGGFAAIIILGILIIEVSSFAFFGQFTPIKPQDSGPFIFFLCGFLSILIIELIIRGGLHCNKNIKIKRERLNRIN